MYAAMQEEKESIPAVYPSTYFLSWQEGPSSGTYIDNIDEIYVILCLF